jgi:hypothetical protein
MSTTLAIQDLIESVRTEAPQVVRLATVVSIASRVEPALLRRARLELCPGMETGVEVELWHSPLVEASSRKAITLQADVAHYLQQELRQSGELDNAYHLIAECHKDLPEAIRLEEEIAWRFVADDEDATEQITRLLRKAATSLVDGPRPDLAHWVARFLARAPESIRRLPAAWILNLAASSRLGGVQVLPASDPPPGVKPNELFWAIARAEKSGTLFVGREGSDLVLSVTPSNDPKATAYPIPIPLTDPIVVEIDDNSPQGGRLYRLEPSGTEILRIGIVSQTLRLRTAAGDMYDITIPTIGQSAVQAQAERSKDQVALPESPFPGLRPFSVEEAVIFFGRSEAVTTLLDRLSRHRFVVVTGPSGCGKSSLLRAGVIAALQHGFLTGARGRWQVVTTRPGPNAFYSLAQSLGLSLLPDPQSRGYSVFQSIQEMLEGSRSGLSEVVYRARLAADNNVLLIVDQFEEIFFETLDRGQADPREVADPFARLLLEGARSEQPIYVVLSLRSEFLSEAAQLRGFDGTLEAAEYRVLQLTRSQLHEAIVQPMGLFGGQIEPAVVDRMLRDASVKEFELAFLQYVLRRLWTVNQNRNGRVITMADYEAMGGVHNALSRGAESVLAELDEGGRRTAELMFRCLTGRDARDNYTRRPTRVATLATVAGVSVDEIRDVAHAFRRTDHGFLTPPPFMNVDADTVLDISSEALLRGWDQLRKWSKTEAESAVLYRELEKAAREWRTATGPLWTGRKLQQALNWREREAPTAAWANRYGLDFEGVIQFLEASQQQGGRQTNARQQRLRTFRYIYYVSYARADLDPSLIEFLDSLLNEVHARSGGAAERVCFVDQAQIATGQDWEATLAEALQTSKMLVSIISPRYVQSEFTGKEVAFFLQRKQTLSAPVPNILPIIWIPLRKTFPRAIADIQTYQAGMPESYIKEGARYLTRQARHRDDVQQLVSIFALRIAEVAENIPESSIASEPPRFAAISSAWDRGVLQRLAEKGNEVLGRWRAASRYEPSEIARQFNLHMEEDVKLRRANLKYLEQLRALSKDDLRTMAIHTELGEAFLVGLQKRLQEQDLVARLGEETWAKLNRAGIRTIGDAAFLSPERIQQVATEQQIDREALAAFSDACKKTFAQGSESV